MMLVDGFLDVIKGKYPLFDLEIRLKGRSCFCEVSDIKQVAEGMLDWFLVYPYYYQLPSQDEDYSAYIGKKTKNTILVYKKVTNIYGLPTYDKARVVFELPKDLPEEEVYRFLWKVDRTFDNLYRIKRSIDDFMKKLLPSEWRWDNDLKKLVDAIIERRFEEATSLFKLISEKRSIEIPGGFVPLSSCVFKIPQISISTHTSVVLGYIIKIIDSMGDYKKNKALVDFFLYKEEKEFYE